MKSKICLSSLLIAATLSLAAGTAMAADTVEQPVLLAAAADTGSQPPILLAQAGPASSGSSSASSSGPWTFGHWACEAGIIVASAATGSYLFRAAHFVHAGETVAVVAGATGGIAAFDFCKKY